MLKNNNKIIKIESLRGILAIIIVAAHSNDITNSIIIDNFFFKKGYLAVDFFFFISGFIITMKYFNIIKNKKELIYFIIKRFLRLYPLHFLTLIIWSLILLSKFLFNYLSGNVIDPQFFYRNNFESFFLNLFFLHSFILPYPTFNFVSWSISFEFYTYLFSGLIFILIKNNLKLLKIVTMFIIILSIIFLESKSYNSTNGLAGLLRCFISFFWGSFVFLHFYKNFFLLNRYIAYFSIFLLFYSIYLDLNLIILIFLFSFIFIQLLNDSNFLKILNNKFFSKLGYISYCIFMYHMIIIWGIRQVYSFVLKIDYKIQDNGMRVFDFDQLNNIYEYFSLFFVFFITIFISYLSKKYFENFFILLQRKAIRN